MSYIGNTPTQQNFVAGADQFSGNGSTTAFTLSRNVNTVFDIFVAISNVPQDPYSAYSVSGNTLTFTSAPPSGTGNIYVVYRATNVQTFVPTPGVSASFGDVTYTGTLTGSTGVVNIGSGQVYKDASGNVGIGTSSPTARLQVREDQNGTTRAIIQNRNGSGTPLSEVAFISGAFDLSDNRYAYVQSGGGSSTYLAFGTGNGATPTERARIDSSGNFYVGTTTSRSSYITTVCDATYNGVTVTADVTSARTACSFRNPNGAVGSITTSGTATAYNTSSDYRLKENVQPMTGALAKIEALKPVTYTWTTDGAAGEGFIAHELAEVVPGCVTGEKDAVDADGNPVYQGIDTSFLVATLTAAIQEQQAMIEELKAEVAALKGAV